MPRSLLFAVTAVAAAAVAVAACEATSPHGAATSSPRSPTQTMTSSTIEPVIDAYRTFLVEHHARYPRAQAADYYKLIHQSIFGVGHLIESRAGARAYLDREIAALAGHESENQPTGEALLEPLDPQGRLARAHLRPFLAQELSRDGLIDAMIETAQAVRGNEALFEARWATLRALVADGRIDLPAAELDAIEARMRQDGYRAAHHSASYRQAYAPAYRVVLTEVFERLVASE